MPGVRNDAITGWGDAREEVRDEPLCVDAYATSDVSLRPTATRSELLTEIPRLELFGKRHVDLWLLRAFSLRAAR